MKSTGESSNENIMSFFARIDSDNNGTIQFNEMLEYLYDKPEQTDMMLMATPIPLHASAPDRDSAPACGINAALGSAFNTRGRPNHGSTTGAVVVIQLLVM